MKKQLLPIKPKTAMPSNQKIQKNSETLDSLPPPAKPKGRSYSTSAATTIRSQRSRQTKSEKPSMPTPSPKSTVFHSSPSILASGFILDPLVLPPPALDSHTITLSPQTIKPNYSLSNNENNNSNSISAPTSSCIQPVKLPPPPNRKRTIIHMTPSSIESANNSPANSPKFTKYEPGSSNNGSTKRRKRNASLPDPSSVHLISPVLSPSITNPNAKTRAGSLGSFKDPKAAATTSASSLKAASALSSATNSAPTTNDNSASTMTPPTPPNISDSELKRNARRTAHSEIERRRRSKMNQEFESLKILVPACQQTISSNGNTGLHKLVILQETVEYVRYLKKCLETLETQNQEMQAHMINLEQRLNNCYQNSMSPVTTTAPPLQQNSGSAFSSVSHTPIMKSQVSSPQQYTPSSSGMKLEDVVAAAVASQPAYVPNSSSKNEMKETSNYFIHQQQIHEKDVQERPSINNESNDDDHAYKVTSEPSNNASLPAFMAGDSSSLSSSTKRSLDSDLPSVSTMLSASSSTSSFSEDSSNDKINNNNNNNNMLQPNSPKPSNSKDTTPRLDEETEIRNSQLASPVSISHTPNYSPSSGERISPSNSSDKSSSSSTIKPSPRIRVSDLIC